MEQRRKINITCKYNKEIEKAISNFCEEIANNKDCIDLELFEGINRVEYKARGENK